MDSGWDWPWLMYMGTVLLRMTENEFWRCTPRKLFALWNAHKRYNSSPEEQNKPSVACLDATPY
ncbi:MAG: phage tail assembly chaperone [Carboxydocellales bacterium]